MEVSKALSATAPSSSPAFHPFPKLPTEIRLQIWHLVIPEGVYIHLSRHPNQKNVSQHLITRCSPHAIPPLLHTNSEARFVALPYFHILGVGSSRIYFNPVIDTLLLGVIFRTNFEALTRSPWTVLGENSNIVKHVAVYNTPVYPGWFERRMFTSFGKMESFAVMDLRVWEEGTRCGRGRRDPGGGVDYEALREALSPEVLRAEDLVRFEEEDLSVLGRQQAGIWKGSSDSEIDVKFMRLPFPGVEAWKAAGGEGRCAGLAKGDAPHVHLSSNFNFTFGNVTEIGGAKESGSLRKIWRYLGKVFSKSTS